RRAGGAPRVGEGPDAVPAGDARRAGGSDAALADRAPGAGDAACCRRGGPFVSCQEAGGCGGGGRAGGDDRGVGRAMDTLRMRRLVLILTVLWATQARAELLRWRDVGRPHATYRDGRLSISVPNWRRWTPAFFVSVVVGDTHYGVLPERPFAVDLRGD